MSKPTWQQKKIGADLLAASQELAKAKRIGSVGGPLAKRIGSGTEAEARRKIKGLVDLAEKYHGSKPVIAKDERPISWQEIVEAASFLPASEVDELLFTSSKKLIDRLITLAMEHRSK